MPTKTGLPARGDVVIWSASGDRATVIERQGNGLSYSVLLRHEATGKQVWHTEFDWWLKHGWVLASPAEPALAAACPDCAARPGVACHTPVAALGTEGFIHDQRILRWYRTTQRKP